MGPRLVRLEISRSGDFHADADADTAGDASLSRGTAACRYALRRLVSFIARQTACWQRGLGAGRGGGAGARLEDDRRNSADRNDDVHVVGVTPRRAGGLTLHSPDVPQSLTRGSASSWHRLPDRLSRQVFNIRSDSRGCQAGAWQARAWSDNRRQLPCAGHNESGPDQQRATPPPPPSPCRPSWPHTAARC